MTKDIYNDSLGIYNKKHIYLKDIWPKHEEIQYYLEKYLSPSMFINRYKDVFKGDQLWQNMISKQSLTYDWNENSTYVKKPSFFSKTNSINNINNARVLALLGDSVTTDHISPAGTI